MVPPMGALAVGGGTPRCDRAQSPPHCLDGPSAAAPVNGHEITRAPTAPHAAFCAYTARGDATERAQHSL
jgi:hypothetical protein